MNIAMKIAELVVSAIIIAAVFAGYAVAMGLLIKLVLYVVHL